MISVEFTSKYKKDYKKLIKQHKAVDKLNYYIDLIICEKNLPDNCRDHALQGEFSGCRSLHVEPDWILVYKVYNSECVIFLRTGSHSDIYKM